MLQKTHSAMLFASASSEFSKNWTISSSSGYWKYSLFWNVDATSPISPATSFTFDRVGANLSWTQIKQNFMMSGMYSSIFR